MTAKAKLAIMTKRRPRRRSQGDAVICDYCGTQFSGAEARERHQLEHRLSLCRDALKAKLAKMTKSVEEAEVWGQDTVCRLTNEKEAAESKLATARKNYFDLCDAVCRESTSVEDACRQAWETRARLASMTKRAEEAERKRVDGDPSIPMTPYDYGYEQGTADAYSIKMHDAEAKLAKVVVTLRVQAVCGNCDVCKPLAIDTLRAIGIDPSKEQGK